MAQTRKNGRITVRWREGGKQRSRDFRTKHEATLFERHIKWGAPLPKAYSGPITQGPTFREFIALWREPGSTQKTEATKKLDLQAIEKHFMPIFGAMPIETIGPFEIENLKARLSKTLAPKSVNNLMGILRKVFTDAALWGKIEENPAKDVKRIRLMKAEMSFWTFAEVERFLSYSRVHDPEAHDAVAVAVYSGLRRGELQALRPDCLDFERREVLVKRIWCKHTRQIVERTKGKKSRRVPMNEVVYRILRERSLRPPGGALFKINFDEFGRTRLRALAKGAGVTALRFHDLRHTFGSLMAMAGTPTLELKELMGHSSLATTERYMHFAQNRLAGATDRILRNVRSLCASEGGELVSIENYR